MGHQVEAALESGLHQARHWREGLAGRVERDERFARLAVADELYSPEEPFTAYLADRGMALLQLAQALAERLVELGRVLDDPLLAEGFDRRDRGGAGEHVARVGQAAREVLVLHPVGELAADHHRAE